MRRLLSFLALLAVGCGGSDEAPPADGADASLDATVDGADATEPVEASNDTAMPDSPDTPAPEDADASAKPPATPYVYVGRGDDSISQHAFDATTGKLTPIGTYPAGKLPSFLATDPARRFLYAVNEGSSQVAAFSIAKGSGALSFLNRVGSEGGGPAFVAVDGTGKNVLVANYGGGTVAVLRVEADGRLGAKSSGDAPGPNAHAILPGPGNAFVYVPTLGADAVAQYAFDAATGKLTPLVPPKVATAKGAGPRHIAFHPSGKLAFVVNEYADTVVSYAIDAKGTLSQQQTLSTLPAGFDGTKNTGADIHVHPSGKFLYTSNRGHDSIAIFSIDEAGKLTAIGHESTGGKTPRNFALDPSGTVLLAANQGSGTIVTFRIDATKGTLTKLETTSVGAAPFWVGVIEVPK